MKVETVNKHSWKKANNLYHMNRILSRGERDREKEDKI